MQFFCVRILWIDSVKLLSSPNWFTRRTDDQIDHVTVHCGCSDQQGKLACGRTENKNKRQKSNYRTPSPSFVFLSKRKQKLKNL